MPGNITLSTVSRDLATNAVVDGLDVGSATPQARMLLKTSLGVVLATLLLDAPPAFGASVAGTANALNLPKAAVAGAAGTFALFDLVDRDGVVRWSGSITLAGGGGAAIVDALTVGIGDSVQLLALSYTTPAS